MTRRSDTRHTRLSPPSIKRCSNRAPSTRRARLALSPTFCFEWKGTQASVLGRQARARATRLAPASSVGVVRDPITERPAKHAPRDADPAVHSAPAAHSESPNRKCVTE